MKTLTILTIKVDGYNIVRGFDKAAHDPVATSNAVNKILKKGEYSKPILEKAKELKEKNRQLRAAKKANLTRSRLNIIQAEIERLDGQYGLALKDFEGIRAKVKTDNMVFFEPKPGEVIVSDNKYLEVKEAFLGKAKDQVLALNLENLSTEKVLNIRGKKFVFKEDDRWKKGVIIKLGEDIPAGAKSKLSREEKIEAINQRESDRIKLLSPQEKEIERDRKINKALGVAAIERSKMEIEGVGDALEQARALFAEKSAEITAKYQ